MKMFEICFAIAANSVLTATALGADVVASDQQRNMRQEQRIDRGLKTGELSTQQAGVLEREQRHIDRMEARDLKDSSISAGEQAKLAAAENKASQDIYRLKHDATLGNPKTASDERMLMDVQRDVNEQRRIQRGIDTGALTDREAAALEDGQARIANDEAGAAANGRISTHEQNRTQDAEQHQSNRIFNRKHNANTAD
jgi:hypothetical protein